ncbi:Glucose N-acetyltransferase 1 [Penicillium argentinense]|uniref:Glucose N-acetyltransferase 1 n=1 Tax=Penicillium argentinense TaxID=1131581 RepID=A0A9W9KLG0_9EURO|nr:Glucose N-acetyltransferase 1 [Penicillium argentinense]KAJ5111104.1 Glucose N-acetyltransferase 1 [Penicillium argentinense]
MSPFNDYSTIMSGKQVDWSRFAYTQYVTNTEYLCNSVMLFETLHRLGSKADRLLMYPFNYSTADDDNSTESRLLRLARDKFGAKLKPIKIQRREVKDSNKWAHDENSDMGRELYQASGFQSNKIRSDPKP